MMYMPILIKRGNMNIFFCIMMFIMGSFFGSFFTLAVYRLPLKKNITHERSFCPNCNHKLGVLDLFPVFSYIFLGGKCRYCSQKIKIRYLLLETLSGLVFVLAYLSYNMQYPFLEFYETLSLIMFILMYTVLAIIAGIDKERIIIQKNVLMFGFCIDFLYNTFLYYGLHLHDNLYLNVKIIFSVFAIIVYGIYLYFINKKDTIILGDETVKEKIKNNKEEVIEKILEEKDKRFKARYKIDIVMMLLYILLNTSIQVTVCAVIGILFVWCISKVVKKEKVPYGFFLCIFTVISLLLENVLIYY